MTRRSVSANEAEINRRIGNAIVGLQIPILQTPAIWRFAATLSNVQADAAIATIRAYALAHGATKFN